LLDDDVDRTVSDQFHTTILSTKAQISLLDISLYLYFIDAYRYMLIIIYRVNVFL